MNMDLNLLQSLPLFRNISLSGLETMIDCFCGDFVFIEKGNHLYSEKKEAICLLHGSVSGLKIGALFPLPKKDHALVALEDSLVFTMDSHMLLFPCYGCCFFHAQLLENMKQDGMDLAFIN